MKMAVIISDIHFPYHCERSLSILKQIIQDYRHLIVEIIDAGDIYDASALSKFINWEDYEMPLYDEMKMAAEFLTELKMIVPHAKFAKCGSNHVEKRLKRFLKENPAFVGLLKDFEFNYDEEIDHAIPYFPLGQNKIAVIHGFGGGVHFAKKYALKYRCDIICGHHHRRQVYHHENGLTCYGIPCLCKLNMGYLHNEPSAWENGFIIITYDEKNDVYNIEYVMINHINDNESVAIFRNKTYHSKKEL